MKLFFRYIQLLWFRFCGVRQSEIRTSEGLKYLSEKILEQRETISKLKSRTYDLEKRVWELEEHTPEEKVQRTTDMLESWEKEASSMIEYLDSKMSNPKLPKKLLKKHH